MAVDWGLDFDVSTWAGPAPVAAGVLLTLVIFWLGWRLAGRHRTPPPPAPTEVSPPPNPSPYGSARDKRRPGSQVTVLIADPSCQGEPYRGLVIGRSTGGLRLGVDQAVELGAILSIRPAHAPRLVPWIQIEVRQTHRAGDGWVLACQFVQPPPATVLWMFG